MARCVQAAHHRLHNQPIDDQTFAALYTMTAQHRAAAPRRQIAPLTPTMVKTTMVKTTMVKRRSK